MVIVRTKTGQLRHHYLRPVHNTFGPIIESIDDAQAAYLLRVGMIERIGSPAADSGDEPGPDQRVSACLRAIAELELPPDAGAPTVRAALRDAGHRYGNDIVAHAIRARRTLSRTAEIQ